MCCFGVILLFFCFSSLISLDRYFLFFSVLFISVLKSFCFSSNSFFLLSFFCLFFLSLLYYFPYNKCQDLGFAVFHMFILFLLMFSLFSRFLLYQFSSYFSFASIFFISSLLLVSLSLLPPSFPYSRYVPQFLFRSPYIAILGLSPCSLFFLCSFLLFVQRSPPSKVTCQTDITKFR